MLAAGLALAGDRRGSRRGADAGPPGPLVRLQQLGPDSPHLHTDEVRYRADDQKLFHCSYTFGVVDARNPEAMVYLAENLRHTIPGDTRRPGCIHLAWEGDVVYTVHRGNIDNPDVPQRLGASCRSRESAEAESGAAPGVAGTGHQLRRARYRERPHLRRAAFEGPRHLQARRGQGIRPDRDLVPISNNAWGVRVRGTTAFVSDGLAGLAILDVADPATPKLLGRVTTGGQARGLALDGRIAYVAAGSAGLVVVDVSTLAAPRVIGRARNAGQRDPRRLQRRPRLRRRLERRARLRRRRAGAPALHRRGPDDQGSWRVTMVVRAVTSRTLGVAARGDVMFVGNWHQLYSYRVVPERVGAEPVAPRGDQPHRLRSGRPGASASVPLTLTNQGTAPLTVTGVSSDKPQFTATPSQARILPGKTATLTLTVHGLDDGEGDGVSCTSSPTIRPSRAAPAISSATSRVSASAASCRRRRSTSWTAASGVLQRRRRGKSTLLAYFATF